MALGNFPSLHLPVTGELFHPCRVLGNGTYGTVCHMRSASGTDVAAKMVQNKDQLKPQNQREVNIMNSLNHPNIIRYMGALDLIINGNQHTVIFMSYAASGTLSARVHDRSFLNPQRVRNFFRQMLDAVYHMHSLGFTHNDLKPDNILLANEDTVKLADFGMAHYVLDQNGMEKRAVTLGTVSYNSPLKAAGLASLGTKDDVWALGLILCSMASGCLPWKVANPNDALFHHWMRGDAGVFGFLPPMIQGIVQHIFMLDDRLRPSVQGLMCTPYYQPYPIHYAPVPVQYCVPYICVQPPTVQPQQLQYANMDSEENSWESDESDVFVNYNVGAETVGNGPNLVSYNGGFELARNKYVPLRQYS